MLHEKEMENIDGTKCVVERNKTKMRFSALCEELLRGLNKFMTLVATVRK